ncbi:MAG: LysM peptidoglycan-binding domain-containing protein, partial [Ruminococcus sp.]|nr:LysM peptidoglycan-binding domain-containing protein [Ruminococcus sp.]
MLIHIVKEGETVSAVAARYGISREWLTETNGLVGGGCLSTGQALAIVFPLVTHTVEAGETLYSIASRYGTSLNTLYKNNLHLRGMPEVYAGETLAIQIERTPFGSRDIGGYAYPFINKRILNTALPLMNALIPFTYGFTTEGALVAPDDEPLLARAAVYGTRPVMHLSTLTEDGVFSTENGTRLLSDRSLWYVLCDNIIENMNAKGYVGLDVDFEYLGKENASLYAGFIAYLRERLNAVGYTVTVALAPKVRDDQPGILYEGHDYRALGEAADSVLLMTYEWGYTYGPAQAVAPLPNVRR